MPRYNISPELRGAVRKYLQVDLEADSFAGRYEQLARGLYGKLRDENPYLDDEEHNFLKDTLVSMIQERYEVRTGSPDYPVENYRVVSDTGEA